MHKADDLLATAEVSALTGWSVTSINRWAAAGDLPYEHKSPGKTGGYVFRRSVIEQRLNAHGHRTGIARGPRAPAA